MKHIRNSFSLLLALVFIFGLFACGSNANSNQDSEKFETGDQANEYKDETAPCPHCQAVNPKNQKFCGDCGKPLTEQQGNDGSKTDNNEENKENNSADGSQTENDGSYSNDQNNSSDKTPPQNYTYTVLAGDYFCLNGSEIVSSDPAVVTVVTENLLRAAKSGTATVTVKNDSATSMYEVTVLEIDTSFLDTDYRNVKKADIDKAIDDERNYFITNYAEYIAVTDRTDVRMGDKVAIDYIGKKDGVAFEGGTGSYDLIIGSHAFIEGFEEGLVGKQVGTTVDLPLSFPDPYPNNPDLAGQPVIFTVTIKSITATEEYSDAFIKKFTNGEYETVAAFEEYLRKTVISDTLFEAITKALPESIFHDSIKQQRYNDYIKEMIDYLSSMGMNVSSKKDLLSLMGYSEEQFDAMINENIINALRQDYVFYGYCQANNLTLSEDVFNECSALYLARYNCKSLEELLENYDVTYDTLYETFLYEEVSRALYKEAVIA